MRSCWRRLTDLSPQLAGGQELFTTPRVVHCKPSPSSFCRKQLPERAGESWQEQAISRVFPKLDRKLFEGRGTSNTSGSLQGWTPSKRSATFEIRAPGNIGVLVFQSSKSWLAKTSVSFHRSEDLKSEIRCQQGLLPLKALGEDPSFPFPRFWRWLAIFGF